ncbi:MAG: epoxyqueuosine reductase QueH [Clostridiales bacterium]|nr:epoxyqueuosine reductase QueH [Clostridiales bacterium]
MNTLLHICCAPCSIMCVQSLRLEGKEPSGLFDNPNIHPFTEYRARRDALIDYAKGIGMELEVAGEYGLRRFVEAVHPDFDNRCRTCYSLRAEAAASFAAANGFSSFTTTLLISPYQNHALLKREMERAAQRHGVEFLYRDFRPLFREGQRRAREMGLYMQKYCGCVFSEEERYRKPAK